MCFLLLVFFSAPKSQPESVQTTPESTFCLKWLKVPKGPRCTKNATCSKFTTRSVFTIALIFAIAAHLVRTPFSRKIADISRVFGEGVKSARGETAIPRLGDHTRNMFGTSLHTTYCKQTIALETAEIMQ